jgi:hypothetical protein
VAANHTSGKIISYPAKTIDRAELALRCAPFHLALFAKMRWESVSVPKLAGDLGIKAGYTRYPLSELSVETATAWLIQVGMLRKEVDGQGLTDSFRLTPLGLELIEKYEDAGGILPPVNLIDRINNWRARWLRLPF